MSLVYAPTGLIGTIAWRDATDGSSGGTHDDPECGGSDAFEMGSVVMVVDVVAGEI